MKRFLLCFLCLFILFSFMIFIWVRQSGTNDVLDGYQKKMPFSEKEMKYQSVSRSMTDNGLVFYHPSFPSSPLIMKVERMNLNTLPNEIIIRLSGIRLDIAKTLLKRDGGKLAEVFNQFEAPYDFLLKPLETLAILNQDIWEGIVEIRIRKVGKIQKLLLSAEKNGTKMLTVETEVIGDIGLGLWHFLDGLFQNVHVEVFDNQLLNAIAGYYGAINTAVPEKLKKALNTGAVFKSDITLSRPWPISKLSARF